MRFQSVQIFFCIQERLRQVISSLDEDNLVFERGLPSREMNDVIFSSLIRYFMNLSK